MKSITEEQVNAQQQAVLRTLAANLTALGCALLPVATKAEIELEMYAAAHREWIRVSRGDPVLLAAWAKVAASFGVIVDLVLGNAGGQQQ